MPQAAVAWSVACVALVVAAAALAWVAVERRRRARPGRLPSDWAVGPRPVFNTDERRLRRRLAEAFPGQLVLTKLQLTRFCQPDHAHQLRYWYDLLSPLYVSFAISSESGRVLAVVDIDDTPEGAAPSSKRRRALRIKQAVFEACRIRYARCPAGQLPTVAELRTLLPDSQSAAGAPAPAPTSLSAARAQLAQTVASRRRARADVAREPADFQDSFFSADRRFDPASPSGFDILSPAATGPGALDEFDPSVPRSARHRADLPVLMTEVIAP
jgi:hypothetical protein